MSGEYNAWDQHGEVSISACRDDAIKMKEGEVDCEDGRKPGKG